MATTSQEEAMSTNVEGITPAHDEWKRKVVDNIEAEKRCKFKAYPLTKKTALEIEVMR